MQSPCLSLSSAGIIYVRHHARHSFLLWPNKKAYAGFQGPCPSLFLHLKFHTISFTTRVKEGSSRSTSCSCAGNPQTPPCLPSPIYLSVLSPISLSILSKTHLPFPTWKLHYFRDSPLRKCSYTPFIGYSERCSFPFLLLLSAHWLDFPRSSSPFL